MKRRMFARQLRKGDFGAASSDLDEATRNLSDGDWVIDVGANVGHYTKRFSDSVGPSGRVIAVEPVPETFELLASNAALFENRNVTLLGTAASDKAGISGMSIPAWSNNRNLKNFYRAALDNSGGDFEVLTIALDDLSIDHPVKLIKVDAEGHDAAVIRGLRKTIERDHPLLVVETVQDDVSLEVVALLEGMSYTGSRIDGTANSIFRHQA